MMLATYDFAWRKAGEDGEQPVPRRRKIESAHKSSVMSGSPPLTSSTAPVT
jgi:hypothetical protein